MIGALSDIQCLETCTPIVRSLIQCSKSSPTTKINLTNLQLVHLLTQKAHESNNTSLHVYSVLISLSELNRERSGSVVECLTQD